MCCCHAMGLPWSVACLWDAVGLGHASQCQTLPGAGSGDRLQAPCPARGGVLELSPARGRDSPATGAVAVPVCGLLSLLSQPLCFGRQCVCANGKLTSESVHMCNQQCWGKETGIYPAPIALDNASAGSLSSG